jgi:hypothetical protein
MAQIYAVAFDNVTWAAASGDIDIFELAPADDRPIELVGLTLSQSSELGDAAEEQLRIKIIRGHTTGGSGGTAPTPVPLHDRFASAGCVVEMNNTTIASTGTPVDLWSEAWNVRSGLQLWWPPEARPRCDQGATLLVVRLMAAVADDMSASGVLYFMEP